MPSPDSLTVRLASAADIPAIHAITREAFAQYARDLGLPGQVKALAEVPADILRDLAEKRVFVAVQDGAIVGSVRCEYVGTIGYISRFGVSSAVRGNGAGASLLETAADDAARHGLRALALHTSSRMFGLMRFYYGQEFYVHSTATDRGYIRALLVRDLSEAEDGLDLAVLGKR